MNFLSSVIFYLVQTDVYRKLQSIGAEHTVQIPSLGYNSEEGTQGRRVWANIVDEILTKSLYKLRSTPLFILMKLSFLNVDLCQIFIVPPANSILYVAQRHASVGQTRCILNA